MAIRISLMQYKKIKITHLLPRFERVTPTVPINILANPSACSTVQVEKVRGGMDYLVALLGYRSNVR